MQPQLYVDSLGNLYGDSMIVKDRFGNQKYLFEISSVTPAGVPIAMNICQAGFFELHFIDGLGVTFFDDTNPAPFGSITLGQARSIIPRQI